MSFKQTKHGKIYQPGTITGDSDVERNMKHHEAVEGFAGKIPHDFEEHQAKSKEDMKFDQEKPIAGALIDFDLALIELSKLLTLGAAKYERSSWKSVPDAEQRYYDGLWRHLLRFDDVEGNLGHDVAVVFNALVCLQLRLEKENNNV